MEHNVNECGLQKRRKQFALRVMKLVDSLPQMADGQRLHEGFVPPLHDESSQLVAIMAASRITASKNRRDSIANRKSAIHEDS